jgi:TPR repeat protein
MKERVTRVILFFLFHSYLACITMSDKPLHSDSFYSSNTSNSLHQYSKFIQNFYKIDTKEIEPTSNNINNYIFEGDLSEIVDELVNFIFKELNEGKNGNPMKQDFLNYINSKMISSQEIHNWLLINHWKNSNSTYLFGYFYYNEIGTASNKTNKLKAIFLYHKAARLENVVAQLVLTDMYILGKGVDKDYKRAFELSKKLAEGGHACGMNNLGFCYERGIGTEINKEIAFELYQKVAELGNSTGICNLGWCYYNGIGTNINIQKAVELFQKAADLGNSYGLNSLGNYYYCGIGTDVNKQKAFELYQKSANLGNDVAQYSLALMYENGDGIKKDTDQAIYWCKKSAEQENEVAQNKLKELLKSK